MADITTNDIMKKCGELKDFWNVRNSKFKDWYDLVRLNDEMEEDNMESFVSNRPRTFFNLSLHLIDSPVIPHRYPVEGLTDEEIQSTSEMETILKRFWKHVNRKYKNMGRQSATRVLASHILALGWYSVFMDIDDVEPRIEVWHPADVFPAYNDKGLSEVAHIYKVPTKMAKQMYRIAGMSPGYMRSVDVTIFDYWWIDDDGDVSHAICTNGNKFLKEPEKTGHDFIPVLVGPVGGLPDMGQLDTNWQEHCGEAEVAVNEGLYKNYNRMKSFIQQATRDSTEPKWFEKSTGTEILDSASLKISGAIFRGGPQDDIRPLGYPPIAVELSQNIFSYEQEIQEGSFSSLMFGSVQVQVAAYTLSQMAQSAQQVLRPYHEQFQDVLECIDDFWTMQMQTKGYTPFGLEVPKLPDITIEVDFPIAIPGDLVNRATIAKMLAPDLTFSAETVMDMLFPAEVSNPVAETARSRANRAMNSEIAIMVDQIEGFRAAAQLAEDNNNRPRAKTFTTAANAIEYQLEQMGAPAPPPPQAPTAPPPQGGGQGGGMPMGLEQAAAPMTPPGVV